MCCQVMMLSYMSTKQMLFSVLTRKGRSLGTTFLPPDPPRSRSWLKRQISVGSSLRPYSADTTEGTRCPGPNRPSDSSGQPMAGARPHRLWPEGHCHYFTEAGIGEKFTATSRPQPDQWAVLARALEPCRTQPPACSWTPPPSPSSHADLRPAELEGPMEKPKIHFLPHSLPEDHDSANSLLNGPTKGHSLTVGCL